uniref:Aminomethyltransferase C-terminal domain-containing protein n=1 Tax=Timema monikensis TaxID=170555 RepID=A0A7R9DZ08_9NEOP|nr:unnamed protein product [Timema monikensis]
MLDISRLIVNMNCFPLVMQKGKHFIGQEALEKQRSEGVKRMYVQLVLNDHDPEFDVWPCGNEPIYKDGQYVGLTTTTAYGFTFKKQVCLGFVKNLDSEGQAQEVTTEFVLSGNYEVDIAGVRYSAKVNLHSPNLPTQYPDKERGAYLATREEQMTIQQLVLLRLRHIIHQYSCYDLHRKVAFSNILRIHYKAATVNQSTRSYQNGIAKRSLSSNQEQNTTHEQHTQELQSFPSQAQRAALVPQSGHPSDPPPPVIDEKPPHAQSQPHGEKLSPV